MIEKYYSHGKLLITGEYLVLQGAKALALPVNLGQSIEIEHNSSNHINWHTFEKGHAIFSATFSLTDFTILKSSHHEKSNYISNLLKATRKLNSLFLNHSKGCTINANIEFDMQWGLGTSSTLINNLAQWSKVNPFELNALISKGSGYDIACASAESSLLYQIIDGKPIINLVEFNPPFLNNLTLIYLNKKMATENNINNYMQNSVAVLSKIDQLNALTQKIIRCESLLSFMELMDGHENLISSVLNQTPVKQRLFSDFDGSIKSLGAWGGDFILAASQNNFKENAEYFNNKGYTTVIPFRSLMI